MIEFVVEGIRLKVGLRGTWCGTPVTIISDTVNGRWGAPRVRVVHGHGLPTESQSWRVKEWAPVEDLRMQPIRRGRPKGRRNINQWPCGSGDVCFDWGAADECPTLRPPGRRGAGEQWASVHRSPHGCLGSFGDLVTGKHLLIAARCEENGGTAQCSRS